MKNANYAEPFVLFEVAGNTCGVRSRDVQSVESPGHIVPSINLRTRFGFPVIPAESQGRMLVVRSGVRTVGMLVDSAREFTSIPADAIEPQGDRIVGFSARYVEGIATLGRRSVLVLNLDEVIRGV